MLCNKNNYLNLVRNKSQNININISSLKKKTKQIPQNKKKLQK